MPGMIRAPSTTFFSTTMPAGRRPERQGLGDGPSLFDRLDGFLRDVPIGQSSASRAEEVLGVCPSTGPTGLLASAPGASGQEQFLLGRNQAGAVHLEEGLACLDRRPVKSTKSFSTQPSILGFTVVRRVSS